MLKHSLIVAFGVSAAAMASSGEATAAGRDQIRIAGSSTVFPFSTAVAEEFGRSSKFKTPIVESTGTGGGFKLFCSGVGVNTTDISNASRAIKKSELDDCLKNGVTTITEVKIGFDGIVFANSKKSARSNYTLAQIWLALAKEVPVNGKLVANPYRKWSDIDSSLPNKKIEVLGPPPTSGTRDAFAELAMEGGCKTFPDIAAFKDQDKKKFEAVCMSIREDGVYVEVGENDNLIVQKLEANPNAYGVFGYSFLDQNADKIQGSIINKVEPTFDNIAGGSYKISRPLFIYVKNAHVGTVPGIKEYLVEYTSDKAWGEYGYLTDKGLIPLPDAERAKYAGIAKSMTPLNPASVK